MAKTITIKDWPIDISLNQAEPAIEASARRNINFIPAVFKHILKIISFNPNIKRLNQANKKW